ncbi:MAG: tyrosine-type recombinase/integrase [Gaiellaceae bacterium]
MASLQARHTRACALGKPWTPYTDATEGCTCAGGPTYYVVVREGRKLHRERIGKNRRQAERALTRIQASVDEGAYQPQATIRFTDWGERWLRSLERKENTVRSYVSTIALASEDFGDKVVRRLTTADIAAFNLSLRERSVSASTRAKHLRVLGACLNSAVQHGYAGTNPVRALPKAERPRPMRKEAAYFENEELPRLFAAIEPGLFRTLFLVALKTGMRQGELVALSWGDLDLSAAVGRVRRTYTAGFLSAPKNHERRDVDLTADVVELLGEWWGECGRPGDDVLVFPGDGRHGYIIHSTIRRRELYPAMTRAGISRAGPTGELRTFHSFRHTFAKRALESGTQITWLSRHLGHSSLSVTTDVYGHWERAERKRQAELLLGAFGV